MPWDASAVQAEEQDQAATRIQAAVRGMLCRHRARSKEQAELAFLGMTPSVGPLTWLLCHRWLLHGTRAGHLPVQNCSLQMLPTTLQTQPCPACAAHLLHVCLRNAHPRRTVCA